MSVYLYPGGFRLIRKSGVGQALLHQQKALAAAGVPLARTMGEGDIVHINTVFPDSLLAALAARLSGKKVVYYAHSTMEDFRRSFPGSDLLAPLFKRWIKLCYIRFLYDDFYILAFRRENQLAKEKGALYGELLITNYDPRPFMNLQMNLFGAGTGAKWQPVLINIPRHVLKTL